MSQKQIVYTVREIILDNGKQEILCMTNQEYAGYMRRKGQKKKILTNKKLLQFTIGIKNFLQ